MKHLFLIAISLLLFSCSGKPKTENKQEVSAQGDRVEGFFVKFGGTSSIVNKESWLSVVCFLPYCTSAFLPL